MISNLPIDSSPEEVEADDAQEEVEVARRNPGPTAVLNPVTGDFLNPFELSDFIIAGEMPDS